ncbi:jg13866 [Pararge aegeria aegeria]|uniref:Jg13866 protein n=1 Tax=Pararge aegeria aegeria TaxID=348720 RepID=A0A8S4SF96_9NEOP|nr:jg13866 [Pararge aegeria aegeria]
MAWIWLFSFFATVVTILKWNDALNMTTFSNFMKKFRQLVDEMSEYFQPCGFPIELVDRLCIEKNAI